jgi:hypothetical protein
MTMRKVALAYSGIHLTFVALLFLFNSWYSNLPSEYSIKNKQLSLLKSVDVLVLGSSHTYFGVDPSEISSTSYNAALVSQSYKYDFLVLNSLIRRQVKVNCVILPISSFSRGYDVETGIEQWRKYLYWHRYKLHVFALQDYFDIRSYIAIMGDVDALGSLRCIVTGNATAQVNNVRSYGSAVNEDGGINGSTAQTQAAEAATRHLHLSSTGINGEYWFRKIVELCKASNCDLILISTPVTSEYYQLVSTKLKRDQKELYESAKSIKTDVVFRDYSQNRSFVYRDFYDCDHLNPTGAKKLGRLIRQERKID